MGTLLILKNDTALSTSPGLGAEGGLLCLTMKKSMHLYLSTC